jgi:hypothetical protein
MVVWYECTTVNNDKTVPTTDYRALATGIPDGGGPVVVMLLTPRDHNHC